MYTKTPVHLFRAHFGILIGGCAAGLAAAFVVCSFPFDFPAQINEAKRLGIVSLTILNGYPKSRDVLCYAALVLLPVTCSLSLWLAWSRGKRAEIASRLDFARQAGEPLPGRTLLATFLLLLCLVLKFNINNFYAPTGGWAFLGEEGQFLADVQVLLSGGEYARDFFSLYGPLVVYPLAWAMKLFGVSMVTGRVYSYALSVLAATILVMLLDRTIRNRSLFIFAVSAMGGVFISGGGRTSATMLRVMLGFLPLLILYRTGDKGKAVPAFIAGALLGTSLLYSQEVGVCAAVAAGVFLLLQTLAGGDIRGLLVQGGIFSAACTLVLAPVFGYFHGKGALGAFFESLYGYPKYVTLGYGSLPFPSVGQLLSAPLSDAYFPYWMIGIYICGAINVLVLLFLGRRDADLSFRAALLVFG
ncbi:MAG TPA: hypothetical protein VNX25_02175, partial [Verrucomicrobiae bacterium]|nr:hypothetical protein [Verrucomicrobiae bacterium]